MFTPNTSPGVRSRPGTVDVRDVQRGERGDRYFVAVAVFAACSPTYLPPHVSALGLAAVLLGWMVVRAVRWNQSFWDLPNLPTLLLLLLAGLSLFWSGNVSASTYSLLGLYVYTIIAIHCATLLPARVFIDGFAGGMKLFLTASVAAFFLLPSLAIVHSDYETGAFQGLAYHRNYMAYIAALSALTFQWKLMNGGRRPRLVAWWAVSVACLVATASVTSITLFVLWSVLLTVVSWLSSRRSIWTAGLLLVFSLGAAAAYLLWSNLAAATEALGRDPTLTGRTEIWRVVWQLVESNFWFGYGWNAWALGNPVGDSLRSALGFNVTHAHNGYLNVALELGIVGLALLVWLLILVLTQSLSRVSHRNAFLWMFVVIGMIVSASMAENRAFLNLGWFLIVAIGLYVGRHGSVERHTSASQGTD